MPDTKTDALQKMIAQLGFPIVVAAWLLYERWTILDQQSETLRKLTDTINQNSEVVKLLMNQLGG